jgi:PHD/YefM family antitoxin component YafN of YafNO toxin-antitoxin module
MVRTISASQARTNIDAIFASVKEADQDVIVEDQGIPVAVVISPERYEELVDQDAEADWAIIHEMQRRNAHLDPDEVLREVTAVVEEVRQERYEEQLRASQGGR